MHALCTGPASQNQVLGKPNPFPRVVPNPTTSFEEFRAAINEQAPPGQKLEDLDAMPEEAWEMIKGMVPRNFAHPCLSLASTVVCGR